MPLFLDIHRHIPSLTKAAVEEAHQKDLATQGRHYANFLNYWFNDRTGDVFCLVEAPSKEAAVRVHQEAHGLVADEVIEVREGD